MSETPKIAYVTKYALTDKIRATEIVHDFGDGTLTVKWPGGDYDTCLVGPHNYALTMPEAIAQAEKKRLAKLKSLEKQAEKLRALSFG